jgi:RelE toxin of RelE / RelB toxin-antitoxin system
VSIRKYTKSVKEGPLSLLCHLEYLMLERRTVSKNPPRPVRVGRAGLEKRGGARVIYILRNDNFPIFLMAAYGKNEKASLSKKERNELAKIADSIFNKHSN